LSAPESKKEISAKKPERTAPKKTFLLFCAQRNASILNHQFSKVKHRRFYLID
jgi:hypothetical protein